MKIAKDGTVQIPPEIQKEFHLEPGIDVNWVSDGGGPRLVRADLQAKYEALRKQSPLKEFIGSADVSIGDVDEFIEAMRGR
ncbi:MAG: hypothetical protein ACFBZ8_11075 [Opitutales bacterium]